MWKQWNGIDWENSWNGIGKREIITRYGLNNNLIKMEKDDEENFTVDGWENLNERRTW